MPKPRSVIENYRIAMVLKGTDKVIALGEFVGIEEGEALIRAAKKLKPQLVLLCPGDPMLKQDARPDPDPHIVPDLPFYRRQADRKARKKSYKNRMYRLAAMTVKGERIIAIGGRVNFDDGEKFIAESGKVRMVLLHPTDPLTKSSSLRSLPTDASTNKAGNVLEHAAGS